MSDQRIALAPPELEDPPGLTRHRFAAMGTEVSVLAPTDRPDVADRVRELFEQWEQALSRFRADSELSRLNARAGDAVRVGPLLFRVTRAALDAAAATGGRFDPTLLRQLVAAGYDRTFTEIVGRSMAAPPIEAVNPGGAWRAIQLDPDAHTVRVPAGVMLDFGGLAKGMAVDAALASLVAVGASPASVDAGGDLAVTPAPDGTPWPIAVETGGADRLITLWHGAVATSGTMRRRWRSGGEERHHLIDPRTGRPAASDLRSVTVTASSCAQAEVAAKCALILGADAGTRFVEALRLGAILVTVDGEARTVGTWRTPLAAGAAAMSGATR